MLSDAAVRQAKPADAPYKLTDSNGLHLYVTPPGGKFWRCSTRIFMRSGGMRHSGLRPSRSSSSDQSVWQKPLSENALGYLMHRAGYHGKHVPHGWRSTFSTCMNERYPADRAVIDLMLAHAPKNEIEGAYNRAAHMERRRDLAQIWAALLLKDAVPAADVLNTVRRMPPGFGGRRGP